MIVLDGETLPVRAMRLEADDERGYVYQAWTRTVRSSRQWRSIDDRTFQAAIGPLIDRVLGSAELAVVCMPDDPWQIVAFAAYEASAPVLYYLHVRGGFRGQGIAAQLLSHLLGIDGREDPFAVTFETADVTRAIERGWNIIIRPELLEAL